MLDNGAMSSILCQLILDQLHRVSPFPAYRAPRSKKTSGKRSKYRGTLPHQGHKEIARRKRQNDAWQLDFTASGQMHIKGNRRLMREAYEESRRQYQLRKAAKVVTAN